MDKPEKPTQVLLETAEIVAGVEQSATRRDTRELPVTRGVMRRAVRVYAALGAVFSALAALGTGYAVFVSKAEAAGTKAAVEATQTAKQADRKSDNNAEAMARMQAEFTAHVETESERGRRMEKKMNAVLDRLEVKDPAPTPKDGGR